MPWSRTYTALLGRRQAIAARHGLVAPGLVVVGNPCLAVVPFHPDAAAGSVECVIEMPELAGVDDAICAVTELHRADFALFFHQIAKLTAGQAAVRHAGADA